MQKDITNFLTVLLVLENNNKVFGPIVISSTVGLFPYIYLLPHCDTTTGNNNQ